MFIFYGLADLVGLGLLHVEVSRSHFLRLLWTSDRPFAENSVFPDNTQHSQETSMPPTGFEPAIIRDEWLQTHARSRCHWDRHRFM